MLCSESIAIGRLAGNAVEAEPVGVGERDRDAVGLLLRGLAAAGGIETEGEEALLAATLPEWWEVFRPADGYEAWLVEQAVSLMIRARRCRSHDWALRMLAIERARTTWDDDQCLEAEELGARLPRQPALIARRLRQTRQGCDWILFRWRSLAELLREGRDWTEPQRTLALDLLGMPGELREGSTPVDPLGVVGADLRAERLLVAEVEIAVLERKRDGSLKTIDAMARTAAEQGIPPAPDKTLRKLMNDEIATARQYRWTIEQLQSRKRKESEGDRTPASSPCPPESASAPVPSPAPPPIFTSVNHRHTNAPPFVAASRPGRDSAFEEALEEALTTTDGAPSSSFDSFASSSPCSLPTHHGGLASKVAASLAFTEGNRNSRLTRKSRERRR